MTPNELKSSKCYLISLVFTLISCFSFSVEATPTVSEKVQTLSKAIRFRDQGNYEEALEVLDQFRHKYPDDSNIDGLHQRISNSYQLSLSSDSSSPEAKDLLASAIAQQADRRERVSKLLDSIARDLDRSKIEDVEADLAKASDWIEDLGGDVESTHRLEELRRSYWLEKADQHTKEGDFGEANEWLSRYRKDSGPSKSRQKKAEQIERRISKSNRSKSKEVDSSVSLAFSHDADRLLEQGKEQFHGGDYEGALHSFRELEKTDPENVEAKAYQLEILRLYNEGAYLNRVKTREEMLNEVNRSWQRPRIFMPDSAGLDGEANGNPLIDKIRSIKIPRVSFSNLELTAVIETLSELSVDFDPEVDPAQKGVNIVPLFDSNTRENPKVNISLRNLSLEKILQFVTQQVNFQYDIVDEAILVQPSDGPEGSANLLTEFFPLSRATVIRLTGGSGKEPTELFSDNPFEVAGPVEEKAGVSEEESLIKGFFQRAGVEFAGIRGASLAFDGTQLIVTQSSRNLERMRNILRRYEKTRQVEIEAKFLEVQQEDLEELGFDWTVRSGGKPIFDSNGNPVLDATGTQVQEYDTTGSSSGVNRSLAEAFSLNQFSQGIQITSPQIVGGQLSTPFQAPTVPQGLDFARALSGGVLEAVGILGETEVGVVIRALSRKEGSDLMSAPRLTVLSGKTASITVAQELRYPESYGDMEAQVSEEVATTSSNGTGGAVAITSGTPQDFVVRNVGVEMEVTPTVEDNDNISLLLEPQVTEFEGFVEYGGPSVAISGELTATVPSGFYQPIFSTRSVKTEVTIYDGATVVIGGLTREEIKAVNDKVPLLGDIPYLGRLFRSEGEVSKKRNLLIFVTANLIGPGGSPIKQEFPNIEPNSMFQNPTVVTPGGGVNRASSNQ